MDIQRLRELIAPYRRDVPEVFPSFIKYGDIVVYPYSLAHETSVVIGSIVASHISHLSTIAPLISLLSKEHRENYYGLSACLLQLKEVLHEVMNEQQVHQAGNNLLIVVEAFQWLLQCTRRQVHDRLLQSLQALTLDECYYAGSLIGIEDIDAIITLVQYVNDEYQRFYEEMNTVLYCGEGLTVSRNNNLYLQEELAGILMLVERSILLESSLHIGLQKWRDSLARQEIQVLLN